MKLSDETGVAFDSHAAAAPGPTANPARSGSTRRNVLRGAGGIGVASLASLTLAACGGDSGSSANSAAPTGSADSESSGGSGAKSGDSVPLSDVAAGGLVVKKVGEKEVVLSRDQGKKVSAFSAICPHQGCIVGAQGKKLVCPCHGSEFSAEGKLLQGPATKGLTPIKSTVTGDKIVLT